MNTITKLQKTIILIYAGNAYSAFRDNDLTKLKSKAKAYLNKFSNKRQYGGGWALTIMKSLLSENLRQNEKEMSDAQKKVWLSIAIGFELTCTSLEMPKILLSTIRLFAAPSIKNSGFSEWVAEYKKELSAYISLIDGLDDLQKDCDIYKIIFEQS